MSIFTKIYMRKCKLLQYCKTTAGAKSVSRLRNLWQMTWSACVQTLTLGDRTCCCCLSQQWRESSDVSYLGKKKTKKRKCCVSQKLKKKYFLFVASVYCTESQRGHVWTILHLAEVSVSLVGEISSLAVQCEACMCVSARMTYTTHTHILTPTLRGAMPGRLKLSA